MELQFIRNVTMFAKIVIDPTLTCVLNVKMDILFFRDNVYNRVNKAIFQINLIILAICAIKHVNNVMDLQKTNAHYVIINMFYLTLLLV